MSRDHYLDTLRSVALFSHCGDGELKQIASITTDLNVGEGRDLCVQGAVGEEFFVLVDGEVRVLIDGAVVATVGAGGYFGEMALLDGGPRIATVTTSAPCRVLVLSRAEFHRLLESAPSVTLQILHGLGQRLRELTSGAAHLNQ